MILIIQMILGIMGQTINMTNMQTQTTTQIYYQNSTYNPQYHYSYPACCTPPVLFTIVANNSSPAFFSIVTQGLQIQEESLTANSDGQNIYSIMTFENINLVTLFLSCYESNNQQSSGMQYFGFIAYNLNSDKNETFSFSIWQKCALTTSFTFDWSLVLIVLMSVIILSFYASLMHIRSVKWRLADLRKRQWIFRWIASQNYESDSSNPVYFQGFRVNIWYMVIYLILTAFFYILVFLFPQTWQEIVMGLSCAFGFILGYFWLNEIQAYASANFRLQVLLLGPIRLCDLLSFTSMVLIIVFYFFTGSSWYMTNLIAFCIGGATLKLFKVTSLRVATFLLTACVVFDFCYYVALNVYKIPYQAYVLEYGNYPVIFQLPLIVYSYDRICCWQSAFEIIIPGIIIAYLNRFDKNRNQTIYLIIGLAAYSLSIMIWILVMIYATLNQIQVPQSLIVYPILIGTVALWAYKQGELQPIWDGLFYDRYIMGDFVEKQEQDLDTLEVQLYRGLALNDVQSKFQSVDIQ